MAEKNSKVSSEKSIINEITEHKITRGLGGNKKPVMAKNLNLGNAFISCGTTGYCGNDGRTFIAVDFARLDTEATAWNSKDLGKGLDILLYGDDELRMLIESLRFILNTLEERIQMTK